MPQDRMMTLDNEQAMMQQQRTRGGSPLAMQGQQSLISSGRQGGS